MFFAISPRTGSDAPDVIIDLLIFTRGCPHRSPQPPCPPRKSRSRTRSASCAYSSSLEECRTHTIALPSVHDGWGIALEKGVEGNAIENAETPRMDKIARDYDFTTLQAHGTAVGLSDGLMGNSEVGYVLWSRLSDSF